MFKIENYISRRLFFGLLNPASLVLLLISNIQAQMPVITVPTPEKEPVEDFTWWYLTLIVLIAALVGAIFWWLNNKKAQKVVKKKSSAVKTRGKVSDNKSVDANKELEWLRKNHQLVGKKNINKTQTQTFQTKLAPKSAVSKVEETQSGASLPIFSITKHELARPYDALPISDDSGLLSAIEQVGDEFEEDEAVREIAVRILTAFKTRNSVESLSQVALYDLSSNLRSKAVTILADFDHESVYETILLACADPTREVRAAAARGLSRLSFDRADAWSRIAESDEEGRIIQAARAAIEGGFVERTFLRLVHSDYQFAYEGFTLLALLIKAGETDLIFDALKNHADMNVRRGILHVIKITKNQTALEGLYALLEQNNLPLELQEEIDKTIEEIGFVTV